MFDLSKIEAGQLTLSLVDYSIGEVVQTALSAVESLATEKHLALKSELPPGLPRAHGDQRRVTQVLLNLVGNAIKFTDADEVAVRASAASGSFTIALRNTGPGISTADQNRIFEEFQQSDTSIRRKKGGTGLGLAIERESLRCTAAGSGSNPALGRVRPFPLRFRSSWTNRRRCTDEQVHSGGRGSRR
jgi:signal transduction histidine kinase